MNIFATYSCPEKSGTVLDDQRLVKMILEGCQLLSTAAASVGMWRPPYPKPTHVEHPCAIWTREARDNWDWLWEHVWAMDLERRRRWGSIDVHKTLAACHDHHLQQIRRWLPAGSTPHVNCARNASLNLDFTHIPDTHLAYRRYLAARWALQPKPAVCTVKRLYVDRRWREQ